MKKRLKFIAICCVVAVIAAIYLYDRNQRIDYYKDYTNYLNSARYSFISGELSNAWSSNTKPLNEIEDLLDVFDFPVGLFEYRYRDIHSKDSNDLYKYYPLFDPVSRRKIACILVSTGIDGEFNSTLSVKDTLYNDSFEKHFKFYNQNYFQREYIYLLDSLPKFNLIDKLFGKKDLLVLYLNFEEDYKASSFDISEELKPEIIDDYVFDTRIGYILKLESEDFVITGQDSAMIGIHDYKFKINYFLNNHDSIKTNGNILRVVGKLVKYDKSKKLGLIENAMLY